MRVEMKRGWENQLDLAPILEQIASAVEDDAKRYAPVDTGALQESIRHEVSGQGVNAAARVGSDLEYSTYQELGTSTQSGTPFLRPALNTRR